MRGQLQSPSSRKPERPDNKVLSTPSDKKKLEKEGKEFDSPLRRSERIEKHRTLSSSDSKKSKKISSLSGKDNGKDEAAGKIKVSGTGEQSKNKIRAVKSAGPSTKKKRLNVSCYRALLLPLENKAEISGSMKYDDPNKVQKDRDECTGRWRKIRSKHSDEYSKGTVEISSSDSRELAELILRNNEERKSIHLVGKRKRKVEDRSSASNCNDSSLHSSGAEKEINGEDDRLRMHNLDKEELQIPELVPTDEGKAIAPSFGEAFGSLKSEKLVDLDSDVVATPVNEEFVDVAPSTADSFSSPIGIDNEIVKQCPDSGKLQRVGSISQAQELCPCNSQRKNDVANLSLEMSFGLPAPVDTSTENGRENRPVVFESERDSQGTDPSSLQTEVSIQGFQADPTNQLVSHSAVPHLPSFSYNILPERVPSEHLVSSGAQSDASLVLAPQVLGSDPLQNELTRILKQDEFCTKMHEEKKLQLELVRDQEIEREIERIRNKYDVLIQDAEIGFLRDKKILERVHNNVLLNRVLAEEFRAKFIGNKGGTRSFSGTRLAPTQQSLQSSHMPRAPRPSPSTSSPDLAPNSVNPSTCRPAGPRAVASVTSGMAIRHTPSIFSTNRGRPHVIHVLPPRTSHQLGIEARAPAPHLRFRLQTPLPVTLQQQHSQISCQQQPLPDLGPAPMVPPCTRTSMSSVSRAYHQSGVPAVSPISPAVAYTTTQLARHGDPNIGANSQTKSCVDPRPSPIAADVCISDEE